VKGWYGAALALFTAVTIGVVPSAAKAAEVRLALAPRISFPKDSPVYSEDQADFYGTNIAILTSAFLRARAEGQIRKTLPSSLKIQATRVPNTSIISITASGNDELLANSFLSALVEQFLRFKHDQKAKYYRDAINAIDSALSYVQPEYAHQLEEYKQRLVIISMLDTKPEFERVEY
jgi:hypothetical protein